MKAFHSPNVSAPRLHLKPKPAVFWLLSLTWGLPMTLAGLLTACVLMLRGHRPQKWGCCLCFEVGERWGGCSLGAVILRSRAAGLSTLAHEHGHALQNCVFGPLMPFLVCIPSGVRYWTRRIKAARSPKKALTPYDAIWFEGQATRLGSEFIGWLAGKR